MNRIQCKVDGVAKGLIILTLGLGGQVQAKENNCWARFYEDANYHGKQLLIQGPDQLANLQSVNGENWDLKIDSLKVGSQARVTVYENPNFKLTLTEMANYPQLMRSLGITEQDIKEDSELIFNADANIHNLADFNFHDKVRSLKVECIKKNERLRSID
ncbi:beta/gamma crystallin domain-containing protein [Methylomarinum vadi]|uniref:beta/gamma crystallin domain-containing protein n=1 Tax=Methylomarinum vadi TaxID=438855 RepID=UPI00068F4DD5|nr:beta/gamma crystallin domain-containing protein [Methylomarinum vadi]